MAKAGERRRDERGRRRPASRDAYREEFERRRAERLSKAIKVHPFDPQKFVQQVRAQSWATIHTVVFVIALTAVCLVVGRAFGAQAWGAFAALLGIGGLYLYLKRVWDIDVLELGKATSMVGVYLTYFITWVMASFLLSNPPFYDDAAPEVHCCRFAEYTTNSSWINETGQPWINATGTSVSNANGSVRVEFAAFDNAAVTRVELEVVSPSFSDRIVFPVETDGVYDHVFTNITDGGYFLTVTAWDAYDHASTASSAMNVV